MSRYWKQGYEIFSRYDEGIWMTDNSWFEVTHESIAGKIASHLGQGAPKDRLVVLDPFCGVGGNVIALAQSDRFKRVYAIEKDPVALMCAKHNAEIYGIADRITWFEGDCFEILGKDDNSALVNLIRKHGVVVASPPWGGPSYKSTDIFDLETMEPYKLSELHRTFTGICDYVALYLPRTSDLNQVAKLVGRGKSQVVHYCTRGMSRALCVYFGDWGKIGEANDN
jgi:trimethylguanosine synthase